MAINNPPSLYYEWEPDNMGLRVWVHASDGSTVGRFDARFGIDIHTTVSEQLAGANQCLMCTHSPATEADWQFFRQWAGDHWNLAIPPSAIRQVLLSTGA